MLGPVRVASELGDSGKLKMLPLRFQRRWAVMMFLWICMMSSPVVAYPVVLNITYNGEHITLGLLNNPKRFEDCVCDFYNSNYCIMPHQKLPKYRDTQSEALSAENAGHYTRDQFFQCHYTQDRPYHYVVSCTKDIESKCLSNPCTVNIIIECSDNQHVVLTWDVTQQPTVLGVTNVPVIDCCKTSTTTTEVTITSVMSPSTTFTTTNTTNDPMTTTFTESTSVMNSEFSQSTSLTPDAITINTTYWETTNQQMGTTDTQLRTSNQQNGTNDESSKMSNQYIGIIVGTAVAAILVTVAIMCICWRLQTRREKNQRNDTAERAMSIPDLHSNVPRHPANEGNKKASRSVALVSPLVQSSTKKNHLTQPAEDYTYIDINSAAYLNSNTVLTSTSTSASPSVEENHQQSTTASAFTETQDGEYSHLGAKKVRQENPYNWVDEQKRSTAIHPVIIPAVPLEQQQLNHRLQSPDTYLRPTDHRISQPTGTSENICLYSNLGDPKLAEENTFNSLHNVGPLTEPGFSQTSSKIKHHAETKPGTTASQNQNLQLFPHTSKHKSMDIVDVVPYTYTEVTQKTTREKSEDSNEQRETNGQTKVTALNSVNLKHLEVNMFKPTIEMAKETDKSSKEISKTIEESQVYANALYSMHENPQEANTGFSLDDADYANV